MTTIPDRDAKLSAASYANAVGQSVDGTVTAISAWVVETEQFNGIVYKVEIALDKLGMPDNHGEFRHVTLYRPAVRRADD